MEVTRVETSGTYHARPVSGVCSGAGPGRCSVAGRDRDDRQVSYVIKMVGPDKTMTKIRPDFDELLTTIKVEEK